AAKELLPRVPSKGVLLFDRGYPSYEFIKCIKEKYQGHVIFRCPAKNTFAAIEKFIKSDKDEDIIWLTSKGKFYHSLSVLERKKLQPIKLRAIKLISPDGTLSILLTDLFDEQEFPKEEIIGLYFRRWTVEGYYRDEKVSLEIERFHSKTYNGILQELFAAPIMAVISRTLMALTANGKELGQAEPQFKNAIMTLASEVAILVPDHPERAIQVFEELLIQISRVKYYRPKKPKPSQPRMTKKPRNKWCAARSATPQRA
ncbi:MAG: transposase, partial [Deltaproteobacteria bacterium]|nr:transposase [Deltaproteobacteria bacterium]